MASKTKGHTQFAALPCRIGVNGSPEVLLLTSRETRRWVIPKGWPIKGLKPREVAAREAYEEAGVRGTISSNRPIGAYHYEKRLPDTRLLCEVRVFLLWVSQQLDDWPERDQREAHWMGVTEAADLVDEGGLADLIRIAFVPVYPQRPSRHARSRVGKSLLPRGLR